MQMMLVVGAWILILLAVGISLARKDKQITDLTETVQSLTEKNRTLRLHLVEEMRKVDEMRIAEDE